MRIFIGLSEICQIENELAKGLNALGHQTQMVLWKKSAFYNDLDYDYIVDEQAGVKPGSGFVARSIKRYLNVARNIPAWIQNNDVFIFIFANSLLPFHMDYPLIKILGKKIISIFCGTDTRYWYAYQQEMEQLNVLESVSPFLNAIKNRPGDFYLEKLFRVRTAEKYSDLILAQASYAQLFVRPYMQFNLPIDESCYGFNIPNREIPVVIHSPSNKDLKGTSIILEVIEQLRKEGLTFEFRFIENVSNTKLREQLVDSDIVIDQIISAIVGKMALEGMATGNAVLGRYMPGYVCIPRDCPMVRVDKFTLKDKLRELIINRELRAQLAKAGRSYISDFHNHIKVAGNAMEYLEMGKNVQFDYYPTFFKEHFKMDGNLQLSENRQMIETGLNLIFKKK